MEMAPSAMLSDDKSQLLGQVDSNAFLTHLLRLQHLQPVQCYVGHISVSCQSVCFDKVWALVKSIILGPVDWTVHEHYYYYSVT